MKEAVKKLIQSNKEARAYYKILETLEAGLKLTGGEVKSLKAGHCNFKGAYVTIEPRANFWHVLLKNFFISPYSKAGYAQNSYQPAGPRILLLTKPEIRRLAGLSKQKSLTIIPLDVYTFHGLLKLTIAVAQGKKLYDRREDLKKRDQQRQVSSWLKQQSVR